mgnify:CR=1 FL=1
MWIRNVFLIIALLCSSYLTAQIKIKGTVTDSTGTVSFVNVLLKEKGNIVTQFTSTNEMGFFEFTLKNQKDTLFLEFSSISYEPKEILLLKNTYDKIIELNVKLHTRITQLKEILLEKEIPIVTKKDTVEYNPTNFKDGSERVIEDLLKKLPGIKVEDNGEIKFKGKPIKKMLLDGDDLFDANYTIGSKNINIDMIDKVQGIENLE